ncbi:MAG TPA: YhjD/YihY/BrkB family envelope integrity protein, partial [Kofleriaceae bacterium]|nr:YhjD/YihY/BrkB family envelope integrity protein [Kofleriaceae bacterium]
MREVGSIVRQTVSEWREDNASRLAAAMAFYTALSLAPLVLIAISIAGLVFGRDAAQGRIVDEIGGLIGRQGAEAIQTILASAHGTGRGIAGTLIGVVLLLLGAS